MKIHPIPRYLHIPIILISVSAPASCSSSDEVQKTEVTDVRLECEVAIVGGGVGGLHTAFRLAPSLGAKVCVFEKQADVGGRIYDIPRDASDPNSPRVGAGARRVTAAEPVLLGLAKELGIELEHPGDKADLLSARAVVSFSKDQIQTAAYPKLGPTPMDRETELYDLLRKGPERARAATYSEFRSYARAVIGEEGFTFLRDVSRFRADFDAPIDARGYLEYLDEEWENVDPSYPKGGMSEYPHRMEKAAVAAGVRIFKEEAVDSISKLGTAYELRTAKRIVQSRNVVIAIPPVAFDKVTGDVAERIRAQKNYQAILPIPVVTVTQFWSEPWWKDIKNPSTDMVVWRAWSTAHCFNFIEIPQEPYAAAAVATRSVYVDDSRCVAFWKDIYASGMDHVESEIAVALTYMFNNGVSTPATVTIPKPVKTHFQLWPDAWHWLRAGATMTNEDTLDWALEPLAGEPVALVGEAYNPRRSGWSDAAYKSSIRLLNRKFGMQLPGVTPPPVVATQSDASRRVESLRGVSQH
jgi:glycine/D-amino acid oxidase-like deaminating enzyme